MRLTTDDSDWLDPEPVDATADTEPAPFAGVYRIEGHGERAVQFPSLLEATNEPPQDPEAEVRGAGGCLAQATPDHCGWAITLLGARRINDERGAMLTRDADAVLAVLLREDFLAVGQ